MEWLLWCERDVFVFEHRIESVAIGLNKVKRFRGFVGEVIYKANGKNQGYLQIWQALGTLAAFCGVGHKTTMGMGAVERLMKKEKLEKSIHDDT